MKNEYAIAVIASRYFPDKKRDSQYKHAKRGKPSPPEKRGVILCQALQHDGFLTVCQRLSDNLIRHFPAEKTLPGL